MFSIDFYRYRYLLTALAVAVIAALAFYAFSVVSSTPTATLTTPTTLTAPATTVPSERPTIPTQNYTLAQRKVSLLVSEASLGRTPSAFATTFKHFATEGVAPHFTLITGIGGFAKYPSVVQIGVRGTHQVICVELNRAGTPPMIPSSLVTCP
jgi:hypothetical protein